MHEREARHPPLPRRQALQGFLAGLTGLAVGWARSGSHAAAAQAELLAASGSGVNVKRMPSPDGGALVPLRESFAFDARYAQCIIEDNPAAFALETFTMGRVVIEPHSFFMGMYANEVSLVSIR